MLWILVQPSGGCTSHRAGERHLTNTSLTRFSLTMPSLAAKKARTWEMKFFSSCFNLSQCPRSLDRSTWKTQNDLNMSALVCPMMRSTLNIHIVEGCEEIHLIHRNITCFLLFNLTNFPARNSNISTPTSSTVQKEACACLYIFQMSGYWMGKMTNRLGFSLSKGSSSVSDPFWQSGSLSLTPFYNRVNKNTNIYTSHFALDFSHWWSSWSKLSFIRSIQPIQLIVKCRQFIYLY